MRSRDDLEPKTLATDRGGWTATDQYPPYAVTAYERRRWDVCLDLATTMSETCEPSGVADQQFVWYTTRSLYRSPLPLDDAERDARTAATAEIPRGRRRPRTQRTDPV